MRGSGSHRECLDGHLPLGPPIMEYRMRAPILFGGLENVTCIG